MNAAAQPSAPAYDKDADDLERWLLKQQARKLLMGTVEREKKVREAYEAPAFDRMLSNSPDPRRLRTYKVPSMWMRPLAAPSPDVKDAEVFEVPFQRTCQKYRLVSQTKPDTSSPEALEQRLRTAVTKKAAQYRVINCSRNKIGKMIEPEIWHSEKAGRASFHKVQVCGSVWTCPTCSRKINLKRQKHIKKAYELVIDSAPKIQVDDHFEPVHDADAMLVTLTIPHGAGDKLRDLLAKLKEANRAMQRSKPYKRLTAKHNFGYIGILTTTEMTYGKRGWHPHLHQLWFFSRRLKPAEIEEIRCEIFKIWRNSVVLQGLDEPVEFTPDQAIKELAGKRHPGNGLGVDVRRALTAEEYLAKTGKTERKWTVEREMASSHAKVGRKKDGFEKGRSPFELLSDSAAGDDKAGDLFRTYAEATWRKHQLEFNHALSKFLQSLEYKEHLVADEHIAAAFEEETDAKILGSLNDIDFGTLCEADKMGEKNPFGKILHICTHEGFDAALAWLKSLRDSGRKTAKNYYVDPDTGEVTTPPSEKSPQASDVSVSKRHYSGSTDHAQASTHDTPHRPIVVPKVNPTPLTVTNHDKRTTIAGEVRPPPG